jgi:hypothetical protein
MVPPNCQRFIRPFYFDQISDAILFTRTGHYEYHRRRRDTIFAFESTDRVLVLPTTAYPVTLNEHPRGWTVDQYSSYCPVLPSVPPTDFESYCSLLEDWESQLLSNIQLHFSPFALASLLENSEFKACSDGSAIDHEGSFGWALCLADGTRLAHGAGLVDGHDPRSFRAEGQGMFSVVCFRRRLLDYSSTTGVLTTDNTGLIARVESQIKINYPVPNSVFKSDWDIVEAIVQTLRASPINVIFEHVKGHQDEETPLEELGLLAQLNVEADQYAGEHRTSKGKYRPLIPLQPTRPVALDIHGKTIHRGFKSAIREAMHGPALLEEMQLRYDWPDGTLQMIDWEAHRQSTPMFPQRRTHFVKLCHELLPTGNLVCSYGAGYPDFCPLCRTPNEDFHHVLRCPHTSREYWRTEFLRSLREKCYALKTSPTLAKILGSLRNLSTSPTFQSNTPLSSTNNAPSDGRNSFRAEYHQSGPSSNRSTTTVTPSLKAATGRLGLVIFLVISSRSGFSYGMPAIPTDMAEMPLRRIWLIEIRLSEN